ncbi:MAG: type II toxin-antitoxin system RelE/ParE family toxin [archaeon]
MVTIVPSSQFKKAVKHLSNQEKDRLENAIKKIIENPSIGKPLRYLRGERTLRIPPFRIIYSFRKDIETLYLLKFDHRSTVYE